MRSPPPPPPGPPPRTPHDALVKATFEQPEYASAQLKHMLSEQVSSALDWSTLRLEPGSYVDAELADRHSDLLFSVEVLSNRAERVWIYVLFEHQSTVDPLITFRLLGYWVEVCRRHLSTHGGTRLPLVIPLLLSHAESGWNAPLELHELMTPLPGEFGLSAQVPNFELLLDDLVGVTNTALRARELQAMPLLTLWLLRDGGRGDELIAGLPEFADAFETLLERPGGAVELRQLLIYLSRRLERKQHQRFRGRLSALLPKTEPIMGTYADELIAEGELKGKAEGKLEGKAETLLKLLRLKFGQMSAASEARVQGASAEELEQYLERVLTAVAVEDVLGD